MFVKSSFIDLSQFVKYIYVPYHLIMTLFTIEIYIFFD